MFESGKASWGANRPPPVAAKEGETAQASLSVLYAEHGDNGSLSYA
jgi:hypothetical protein